MHIKVCGGESAWPHHVVLPQDAGFLGQAWRTLSRSSRYQLCFESRLTSTITAMLLLAWGVALFVLARVCGGLPVIFILFFMNVGICFQVVLAASEFLLFHWRSFFAFSKLLQQVLLVCKAFASGSWALVMHASHL